VRNAESAGARPGLPGRPGGQALLRGRLDPAAGRRTYLVAVFVSIAGFGLIVTAVTLYGTRVR